MGPLKGTKVIEIAGIGPGPFCGMMLSDMGADVIRVERPDNPMSMGRADILNRGRRSVAIDLKDPRGVKLLLDMVEKADMLQEGFRPGVMEKLGLGPDTCLDRNPSLVYGRITGWGQDGPLSHLAGHDINYISLSGALHAIGNKGQKPVPPLNLLGDFGGGAMLAAFGMVCALLETRKSGRGQVVDASMVDGSALLMTMIYQFKAAGMWRDERGTNILDTGAHFYDTYETSDGRWIAVGAIEGKFYQLLVDGIQAADPDFADQNNQSKWPELKEKLADIFKTKTRDEWCDILQETDACFSPVLSMDEAINHPHNTFRNTFIDYEGVIQPAPAPKLSRTKPEIQGLPPTPGEHNSTALADWGFSDDIIKQYITDGVI